MSKGPHDKHDIENNNCRNVNCQCFKLIIANEEAGMANWKLFIFIIDEEDVKMAKMTKMPEWQSVSLSGNES